MEKNNVSTDDFANPKLSKNDETVNNLNVNNMNNNVQFWISIRAIDSIINCTQLKPNI